MGVRRVFRGLPFYLAWAKDQSVLVKWVSEECSEVPVLPDRGDRPIGLLVQWSESCRTRTSFKLHFFVAPTL